MQKRELALSLKLPASIVSIRTMVVSLLFSCFSAFRASDRIIVKTFFFVKSLFALGKCEFRAAVFASQYFVCHKNIPP
jgi:hypothetical protein